MRILSLLSVVLLAGCGLEDGSVWLFSIDAPSGAECSTEVTENFTNGTAASAPTGGFWQYSEELETSVNQTFGQIVDVGGEAILVVGDATYTGTKVDGLWEFRYDGFTDGVERASHASGYEYEESGRQGRTTLITADLSGGTMSGTWAVTDSVDLTYTESDEWDVSVGIISGQIPSSAYLLDFMGTPVKNESNQDDCEGETCSLSVVETCSSSAAFTATKLSHNGAEVFAGLQDAGQRPTGGE